MPVGSAGLGTAPQGPANTVNPMTDWDRVKDLEFELADYSLERLQQDVSSDFTRVTTVIHMSGAAEEGIGEDVTYDAEDHDAAQETGPILPLTGQWTLEGFSNHLAGLDLFPGKEPERDVSRLYRRYAYESAALDLALRQNDTTLHDVVGSEPRPLTYVVSLRLGEPATLDPVTSRLEPLPRAALQARPHPELDRRDPRRPAGDRQRGLGRLQGPLLRHGGRQPRRPRAVPQGRRGVPRRLARGPEADARRSTSC